LNERTGSRARNPDSEGVLERDGVRVRWQRYGCGEPAILFMPTWSIIHARCWKMQIADFARRHTVLTFDPRGNGGSDRPRDAGAYAEEEFARDALAVLDATGTEAAIVVALSLGAQRALVLAGEHPQRVRGLVLIGPSINVDAARATQRRAEIDHFFADSDSDEGWARYNAHSLRRDYAGFVDFFFGEVFSEPHSSKPIEDCVGWGLETDAETLITAELGELDCERTRALAARVSCPALVVHGGEDAIVSHAVGVKAAELTGGALVTFAGSGHCPNIRDPVRFNLLLRQFVRALGGDS